MKHAQLDQARANREARDTRQDWLADLRDRFRPKQPANADSHLDWNLATGGYGSVLGSPAKYNSDITAALCTDVIYFTVDQVGSATAVNVIAITNPYIGCPGNSEGRRRR